MYSLKVSSAINSIARKCCGQYIHVNIRLTAFSIMVKNVNEKLQSTPSTTLWPSWIKKLAEESLP
jgi:hypothetical protein